MSGNTMKKIAEIASLLSGYHFRGGVRSGMI